MCGIAGLLAPPGTPAAEASRHAAAMAAALGHRGPDDEGAWCDGGALAVAHRRLAVLDLSPEGHQPMTSACGRWVLVHNGEIYDFAALRSVLADRGSRFRGGSDTEVMLAAFAEWGVAGALERFNGMFAFALWDRERRVLELARDRMGQKPLYWGRAGDGSFLFASELGAFHRHPAFRPEIDRDALTLLLRRGCIPAPWSVYRGVRKLPAGCRLTVPADAAPGDEPRPVPYWSLAAAWERGEAEPFAGGLEAAADELEPLLADAVHLCRVSDVPVGALLSGGVDSSLVVALLRAAAGGPVATFTVGFRAAAYDEAPRARAIAAHLGTDHHELTVDEADGLDLIPRLPEIWNEPFGDSSAIPTHLVCRLTRRHVTVALSGDGGDELFAGYAKYRLLDRLRRLDRLPAAVVRGGGALAARLPRRGGLASAARLGDFLVRTGGAHDAMIVDLSSIWKRPGEIVLGGEEPASVLNDPARWPRLDHPVRRAMAVDSLGYLPDDVLVKVDRAAMAVALETRIPLLDHRVVEWAARLPPALALGGGESKPVLRRVLSRHLPAALVTGPKRGFRVPLDDWLRGELRPWAAGLLDAARLRDEGTFAAAPIDAAWRRHLAGRADLSAYLWPVLMFQAWRERWGAR